MNSTEQQFVALEIANLKKNNAEKKRVLRMVHDLFRDYSGEPEKLAEALWHKISDIKSAAEVL